MSWALLGHELAASPPAACWPFEHSRPTCVWFRQCEISWAAYGPLLGGVKQTLLGMSYALPGRTRRDQHPDRAVLVGTVGAEPLGQRLPQGAVVPIVEVVEQVVRRCARSVAVGVWTPTPASAEMFAVGVGNSGTAPRSVSRQTVSVGVLPPQLTRM